MGAKSIMLFYHPASWLTIAATIMLLSRKSNIVFYFSLMAMAFGSIKALLIPSAQYTFRLIGDIELAWQIDEPTKISGLAFIFVALIAGLYGTNQKRYYEVISGTFYSSAVLIALLADDFISLFLAIELMMLMAAAIIFLGGTDKSTNSAKWYFLTHLFSSNLILIGISYIISENDSTKIVLITDLIYNQSYNNLPLYSLLAGLLINIAIFPFSGWMVSYYKHASPSGFLYLISFTTKISVMILGKLFLGYEILKYFAFILIIYSGFKAFFEDNLFSLLCYFSLLFIGVVMVGISFGNKMIFSAIIYSIVYHVIYKLLLSLCIAVLKDYGKINLCSELGGIKNKVLNSALFIGIFAGFAPILSLGFFSKLIINRFINDELFYCLVLFASYLSFVALPWREYLTQTNIKIIRLNLPIYLIFILVCGTTILINFGNFFASYDLYFDFNSELIKQITILVLAIIVALVYHKKRSILKSINLVEYAGKLLASGYNYGSDFVKRKNDQAGEGWSISQLLEKLSLIHDQKMAIGLVIILLTIFLLAVL